MSETKASFFRGTTLLGIKYPFAASKQNIYPNQCLLVVTARNPFTPTCPKIKKLSGFQLTAQGRARNLPVYCLQQPTALWNTLWQCFLPVNAFYHFDVILSD